MLLWSSRAGDHHATLRSGSRSLLQRHGTKATLGIETSSSSIWGRLHHSLARLLVNVSLRDTTEASDEGHWRPTGSQPDLCRAKRPLLSLKTIGTASSLPMLLTTVTARNSPYLPLAIVTLDTRPATVMLLKSMFMRLLRTCVAWKYNLKKAPRQRGKGCYLATQVGSSSEQLMVPRMLSTAWNLPPSRPQASAPEHCHLQQVEWTHGCGTQPCEWQADATSSCAKACILSIELIIELINAVCKLLSSSWEGFSLIARALLSTAWSSSSWRSSEEMLSGMLNDWVISRLLKNTPKKTTRQGGEVVITQRTHRTVVHAQHH